MSHFSVMVITPQRPSQSDLEAIMMPWHEYECTGIVNEYVVDVDKFDELKAKFDQDDRYTNFVKYLTDYHGYEEGGKYSSFTVDDDGNVNSVIHRTNPNAKWDWWQVGGRWTGFFAPSYDPYKDPANQEICFLCQGTGLRNDDIGMAQRLVEPSYTCNGCAGNGTSAVWPTNYRKIASDITQKQDVPVESMRAEKSRDAAKLYDEFHAVVNGRDIPNFIDLRDQYGVVEARELYNNDPVLVDIRSNPNTELRWVNVDDMRVTREEYIQTARNRAIVPYAFVRDGNWYERGSMGWFGMSYDEVDRNDWDVSYNRMFDELPDDYWITVIDCHI